MTILEKERDRIRKDEPRTLKNLQKLMENHASMLEVYNYLEDIMEAEGRRQETLRKQFENLQKALDEVEAVVWANCEFGSLGREKMNVLVSLFSVFKREVLGEAFSETKKK